MSKTKNVNRGRPKKTSEDFPDGWEKKLIEIGSNGGSDVKMRRYLNYMCHETWVRLLNEDSHFSETIKKARMECEIWWEDSGVTGMFMGGKDSPFNATVWIFNMKNRFGWRDRIEQANVVSFDERLKDIADKLPD